MTDDINLEYERRKQNRLEKIGPDPVCVTCGESRWECIEQHHVAGRKHHGDVANVCANDHAALSVAQECRREVGEADDPFLATVGNYLMGLGEMFVMIAEALIEFGKALIERAYGREPQEEGGAS